MTDEKKPSKRLVLLFSLVIFLCGFFAGSRYMETVMQAKLDLVHLQDVILRYHDWQRFSDHIRQDIKKFGNKRIPFPSDTALLRTKVKDLTLLKSDGLRAQYAMQITISNRKRGNEILSPENVQLQDQYGRMYSAYLASPSFPSAGIAENASFRTQIFFLLPTKSIPRTVIVSGSSGNEMQPLVPLQNNR